MQAVHYVVCINNVGQTCVFLFIIMWANSSKVRHMYNLNVYRCSYHILAFQANQASSRFSATLWRRDPVNPYGLLCTLIVIRSACVCKNVAAGPPWKTTRWSTISYLKQLNFLSFLLLVRRYANWRALYKPWQAWMCAPPNIAACMSIWLQTLPSGDHKT